MPLRTKKPTESTLQWEAIKSQKSTWLFPLITAVIIITTIGLVLVPQMNHIFEVRAEIKTESERLDRLVAKHAFLKDIPEAEIDEKKVLAEKALPNQKPVYEVIEALAYELEQNGLSLESYDLSPGRVATPPAGLAEKEGENEKEKEMPGMLSSLILTFEATGNRDSVHTFLQQLNKLSPLSGLHEVTVTDESLALLESMQIGTAYGSIDMMEMNGKEGDKVAIEGQLELYYSLPLVVAGKVSDELPKKGIMDEQVIARLRLLEPYRKQIIEVPLELDANRENLFAF